jgi:hypothetical protein
VTAETSRGILRVYNHTETTLVHGFKRPVTMNLKTVTLLSNLFPTPYAVCPAIMSQANQERVLQGLFKTVGVDALSTPRMLEFVDTVSAPLATRMLQQIGLDTMQKPFKLLDNGAGLGVVAAEVQKMVDKDVLAQSSVISADFSESTVELVRGRIEKEGWVNTEARVVDAQVGGGSHGRCCVPAC